MKGISRRARACAVVAVTGVAVLAGSTAASAQTRPEKTGNGIPSGQASTQMFNFGGYLNNGANTGAANPITGVSAACATSTTTTCRLERLEGLFAFFQRKGWTNIELFAHSGFPAQSDIPGLIAYRALLDKYGLHAAGWHGTVTDVGPAWTERVNAAKILGSDYIGSGGVASPGIGSYSDTLRSAEALNRLGKEAVEAGVGPVYIHNHTGEFDAKYVDNGVLKSAWQILMDRTDARYVQAEVDVFWSSDAFGDVTGTQTAALVNANPTRVKMMHIKDGINIAAQVSPTNTRTGSPRPTGTGELDFRPIFAAAKDKVQYYHHEHDGGTITDADTSFTNLTPIGDAIVGTVLALPPTFPSVSAGTPAAQNAVAVLVQNTGGAALNITNTTLSGADSADFSVVSSTCGRYPGQPNGTPGVTLAPGAPATATAPAVPRGTCVVNVGFKPTKTNYKSVAYLQFTSNADNATEQILLAAKSGADAIAGVGGDVATTLSLNIGNAGSFGAFTPAFARNYDTAVAASVISTAGDATLSVTDPSSTATGHLVNTTSPAFSLPSILTVRAANAANANPAYVPLSETAGAPVSLLTYSGPTAGADGVTLGFRQAIGATDTLRSGSYSKTLTFTLSTTTP
jgi:sugar phosphate isomerase/epimerase